MKSTLFVIAEDLSERNFDLLVDCVKTGHQLANHGITESTHAFKSKQEIQKEITDCDKAIADIYQKANVPIPKTKFYRPGGGLINFSTMSPDFIGDHLIALGSVYPHDPFSTNDWVNFQLITAKLAPRDIVILHDRSWTPKLLERLLPFMKTNQFESLTLDECFKN